MLVDLQPKGVTGKAAEEALERANITCNKNGIPFDPAPPAVTSGLRLGTPAGTTRGFGQAEFTRIGELIAEVVDGMIRAGEGGDSLVEARVRAEVRDLTGRFPYTSDCTALAQRGANHALPVLRRTRESG